MNAIATGTYHQRVRAFRAQVLTETLAEHGGNRTHAAAALGLQRSYFLRLLGQLGIKAAVVSVQPKEHKLTPEERAAMRARRANEGTPLRELADAFGVSQTTAWKTCDGVVIQGRR